MISKFESEEFKKFFYRTAHLYYFDSEVLTSLVNQVGFSKYNISFRHNYDLSNLVLWIKEGKPTGCGYIDLFDDEINALWKMKVEQAGLADLVFLEAVK